MQMRIVILALVMMVGTLSVFNAYINGDVADYAKATTMALTVLAVYQWFNAWSCRSEGHSIFKIPLFSNIYLLWSTLIILVLQLAAVYWYPLQIILKTVPLSLHDWFIVIGVSASVVVADEIRKLWVNMLRKNKTQTSAVRGI